MIEYALRLADGSLREGDEDRELPGRLADRGFVYVPAIDPSPDDVAALHRYATEERATVVSRSIGEYADAPKPLPTTVGSVIEIPSDRASIDTPVRLVLREWLVDRGVPRWEVLTPGHGGSRQPDQLVGATVLFEAPEVTR
jgi:hypothetical protein